MIAKTFWKVKGLSFLDMERSFSGNDLSVTFDHQRQKVQIAATTAVGMVVLVEADAEKPVIIR